MELHTLEHDIVLYSLGEKIHTICEDQIDSSIIIAHTHGIRSFIF